MASLIGAYDQNAEAQADLGLLPTGEYVARIIDSDMKPTKDNNGHYLELTYEVTEGPLKGRKHWERLNLDSQNADAVAIANRQFASIREATGVPNPRDSQELHNRPHTIRVEFFPAGSEYTYGKRKGQKRDRDEASIKAWKRLEAGASGNASGAPASTSQTTTSPSSNGAPPWTRKNAA